MTHFLLRFCLVQQNHVWVWFLYFSIMWGYLSKEGSHIQTKLSISMGAMFNPYSYLLYADFKNFYHFYDIYKLYKAFFYFSPSIEHFLIREFSEKTTSFWVYVKVIWPKYFSLSGITRNKKKQIIPSQFNIIISKCIIEGGHSGIINIYLTGIREVQSIFSIQYSHKISYW